MNNISNTKYIIYNKKINFYISAGQTEQAKSLQRLMKYIFSKFEKRICYVSKKYFVC